MMYHHPMEPLLTISDAATLDKELIARYSLSESALIDGAAENAYKAVRSFLSGRVVFLIGPGNNGSDGIAMASLASADGMDVAVSYLYKKGNAENLRRRASLSDHIPLVEDASGADTVVDALFGFGFHGEADERTRDIVSSIGHAMVISLDYPSAGIVDADITVMMTTGKLSLYHPSERRRAGTLITVNPGFPPSELRESRSGAYLLSDEDSRIRRLAFTDYKNSKGHLAAIGGSERFTGAIRLATRASFASGVGLVTIISRSSSIHEECPAAIVGSPSDDLSRYDALLVGPGWGEGDSALFERAVLSGRPLVIDADGLRFVPGHRFSHKAVLTPHIGEYRRLMASLSIPDGLDSETGLSDSLRRASAILEATIVLKSSVLWLTAGEDIFIYDGANPSLGVAGSGDVLSGIIAALLAEGEEPERAAIDGVILHQRAGREASRRLGYYSAEELVTEVGRCR